MAARRKTSPSTPAAERLARLEVLRDQLTAAIADDPDPRDLATLSARLMDALEQIADLKSAAPAKEGTPLDELRRRRATRDAEASA